MDTLDHTDIALLTALQRDSQLTSERLGEILNLSASQVGRRRQRLESAGYIQGYCARLDATKLGLTVQALISVQMGTHAPDKVATFTHIVETNRQIVNAWTLTGEADYLLRVYCADLSALNKLIQEQILPNPAVARVQSQIVMDQLKSDAPLPV